MFLAPADTIISILEGNKLAISFAGGIDLQEISISRIEKLRLNLRIY